MGGWNRVKGNVPNRSNDIHLFSSLAHTEIARGNTAETGGARGETVGGPCVGKSV